MSAETIAADHHDVEDHHPTEGQYWIVFIALAIITAAEVAWAEIPLTDDGGPLLVVPMMIMMIAKFILVAGAFMHLYFDTKILNGKFFWWIFASALVLAVIVYFIVFATFEFSIF